MAASTTARTYIEECSFCQISNGGKERKGRERKIRLNVEILQFACMDACKVPIFQTPKQTFMRRQAYNGLFVKKCLFNSDFCVASVMELISVRCVYIGT